MGVHFYDGKEIMSTTTRTGCNCNTCNQQTATSSTTTTTETATQTTNRLNGVNNCNFQTTGIFREIVGNCKEVRVEDNSHCLRIIGNNNRIRITVNMGDITIIGNNTRLKIKTNHGHIKYTGNDGRISLGKDSTEQLVDYSGCNGVLKIKNSKKSSHKNNDDAYDDKTNKNNPAMGNTNFCYKSSPTDGKVFKPQMDYLYNNIFNNKKSMPNIKIEPTVSDTLSDTGAYQLPKNLVHNFGNIVIANSSNICLFPNSYSF